MLTTPSRIMRTAWLHMQRHGWHTIAVVSIMTLMFFVMTIFALTALGSNVILNYFEKQPAMFVYLKDDATTPQVDKMKQALQDTGEVSNVHYTSKDEALAFYKQANKNDPSLTENISSNILPASLDVYPKDAKNLPSLASLVQKPEYNSIIESVDYQRSVVQRLSSLTSTTRLVGLLLIGFLVLISFLIIMVTISLNISSYHDEIEVMRLVGAGSWYIRGPFVAEGVFYGVVASLIAVGIAYFSLPWVAPRIQGWLGSINIFPIPVLTVFGGLLLAEMVFGIFMGVIGSAVAMRRSLRA